MRLLHCADLHIGKSRKLPGYLERQDKMLSEIFRLAKSQTDGLVVVAGDVYDRIDLTPREKDLFVDHICKADRSGVTTVIISGNHDSIDEDDGGYTHLRSLKIIAEEKRLKRTHVVETNPKTFRLEDFDMTIVCVPSYYRQTKEVNRIVRSQLKELRALGQSIDNTIAVVHETILGSRNDRGQRMGVDFGNPDHCVELDHRIPIRYWALGDIHAPQRIQGCPNAWYCGSPMQHDFGDADERGVLIVDTDDGENPELMELKGVKKLVTVQVSETTKQEDLPTDAYVRLDGDRQHIKALKDHESVVGSKIAVAKEDEKPQAIADQRLAEVLIGLPEIVADLGLSEADQAWMLQEAERVRSKIE